MKYRMRMTALTLAGVLMFPVGASAATIGGVDVGDATILDADENGKYTASYAGTAGKEYVLWGVKGVYTDANKENISFDAENIVYINQNTAGEDNRVSFTDFQPMQTVNSTFVVTGQGMDESVIVGYIEAKGNMLSGSIGLQGRSSGKLDGVTITLANPAAPNVPLYTAITAADGTFTFEPVADGTYTMKVSRTSYLSYTKTTFTVSSDTNWEKEFVIELLAGDVDGNGMVLPQDFLLLKGKLRQPGTGLPEDLDGNGMVLPQDFLLLKGNLRKPAKVE